MLDGISHWEMQIKAQFTLTRMAKIKKPDNTRCQHGYGETNLSLSVVGM